MDSVEQAAGRWRELHPEFGTEALLVVGRVQRLWALWDAELRGPFANAGLNPGDFDVLAALRRAGTPVAPGDLATAMLVTAGATTKRVDRLQHLGLAERVPSATDARQRLVRITAAGIRLCDALMEQHLKTQATLLRSLSPRERTTLASLLGRLVAEHDSATPSALLRASAQED